MSFFHVHGSKAHFRPSRRRRCCTRCLVLWDCRLKLSTTLMEFCANFTSRDTLDVTWYLLRRYKSQPHEVLGPLGPGFVILGAKDMGILTPRGLGADWSRSEKSMHETCDHSTCFQCTSPVMLIVMVVWSNRGWPALQKAFGISRRRGNERRLRDKQRARKKRGPRQKSRKLRGESLICFCGNVRFGLLKVAGRFSNSKLSPPPQPKKDTRNQQAKSGQKQRGAQHIRKILVHVAVSFLRAALCLGSSQVTSKKSPPISFVDFKTHPDFV